MSTSRSSPGRCSTRCPQPAGFASIHARSRLPRAISRIRSSPISTVGEYFAMAPPLAPRLGSRIALLPVCSALRYDGGHIGLQPRGRCRDAVHAGHGFEPVVHLELRKDVLDVVANRGLADEELIGDGRGARPGAHEGDHLQLAPAELRDRRETLAARELELRLGELLPD